GPELYRALRGLQLGGGAATVKQLVLRRDRVEMTFDGTFYFPTPVEGRTLGAVFIGRGTLRATVPAQSREAANVKRLLDGDVVASDLRTAVLRFTDDTFDVIGKDRGPDPVPPREAAARWAAFEPELLEETGLNLSSRMLLSVLHQERPGFFSA